MSSYITGSWENCKFFCPIHKRVHSAITDAEPDMIEMAIQSGPHSLFYSCPKYYPGNRVIGEKACYNRLNLVEAEAALSHIADEVIHAAERMEVPDLTGHKWKKRGIDYEVLSYGQDHLHISVLNHVALHGTKMY